MKISIIRAMMVALISVGIIAVAGPASAEPVQVDQNGCPTIPGAVWLATTNTCELSQDVDLSGGGLTSLEISAVNVTLDCNGYSVTADDTQALRMQGQDGLVQNCTFLNLNLNGDGIHMRGTNNEISGVVIQQFGRHAIYIESASGGIVGSLSVEVSGAEWGNLIHMDNANNVLLRSLALDLTAGPSFPGNGIYMGDSCQSNRVESSIVRGLGGNGLHMQGIGNKWNSTYLSDFSDNSGNGIAIIESFHSTIEETSAERNSVTGLHLGVLADEINVYDSVFCGNGYMDIENMGPASAFDTDLSARAITACNTSGDITNISHALFDCIGGCGGGQPQLFFTLEQRCLGGIYGSCSSSIGQLGSLILQLGPETVEILPDVIPHGPLPRQMEIGINIALRAQGVQHVLIMPWNSYRMEIITEGEDGEGDRTDILIIGDEVGDKERGSDGAEEAEAIGVGMVEADGEQEATVNEEPDPINPDEVDTSGTINTTNDNEYDEIEFENDASTNNLDEAEVIVEATIEADGDQQVTLEPVENDEDAIQASIKKKDNETGLFENTAEVVVSRSTPESKDANGDGIVTVIESDGIELYDADTDAQGGLMIDITNIDDTGTELRKSSIDIPYPGELIDMHEANRAMFEAAVLAAPDDLRLIIATRPSPIDPLELQLVIMGEVDDDGLAITRDIEVAIDAASLFPASLRLERADLDLIATATRVAFDKSLKDLASHDSAMKIEEQYFIIDFEDNASVAKFEKELVTQSMTADDFSSVVALTYDQSEFVEEFTFYASADTTSIDYAELVVGGETLTVQGDADVETFVQDVAQALEPYQKVKNLWIRCGVRDRGTWWRPIRPCDDDTVIALYDFGKKRDPGCARGKTPEQVVAECPALFATNDQLFSGWRYAHYKIELPYGRYYILAIDTDENGDQILSRPARAKVPCRKRAKVLFK